MVTMNTLLACIDASSYAASVTDHAAWAAGRLGASVELLHVIQRNDAVAARHDLSGAMGLGARSSLLEELVAIDEAEGRVARERGRLLLLAAEEKIRASGIESVVTTHRHGGIVETVIEREADADIVVIGKRGASHEFAAEHLGSKVERVIRESIRPVLVACREFTAPSTVMIAFDGRPNARKAVEFAASSKLFQGHTVHVVTAGKRGAQTEKDMAWALDVLSPAFQSTESVFLEAPAGESIPKYVETEGIGMVVMGAYSHSPLRRFIVGSTTTSIMLNSHVPILLFR